MICTAVVLASLAVLPGPLHAAKSEIRNPKSEITEVHYVMGTYLRITAQHGDVTEARSAMRRCFAATRNFDERFSRFDSESELSRLNSASVAFQSANSPPRPLSWQERGD